MSKSKGEFLTISLLEEKGYSPLIYKFFCLQSHYRKQLVFSFEGLDMAKSAYDKLIKRLNNLKADEKEIQTEQFELFKNKFKLGLENDLNTATAITTIFDVLKADINNSTKIKLIKDFDFVLQLGLTEALENKVEQEETSIDNEMKSYIEAKIEERRIAKAEKNYAKADEIRNELASKGIELIDTKEGTTYKVN